MSKQLTVIQILPALDSGGVERGTLEIAHALVQAGHRSIVVSAGGRLVEQLKQQGSEHITLPIGEKRLSTLKYIRPLRTILKDIKPDIIHLRSRLPAWIAYFAWRKLPKQKRPHLVTTVHGPYSINRYSAIMTIGERVIAVSEMIKGYIQDHYSNVEHSAIEVIHRGIDTTHYNSSYQVDNTWLQQWNSDYPQLKNKWILTLPARITAWKGQEDFVSCIQQLKAQGLNVHGLIVGEAHPKKQSFLRSLKQHITELHLTHDITFTGHRSDIQNVIAASDIVFSLAKKPEAFGRTTIEALSMGIPVIGYNHGGVAEQLEVMLPEGLVEVNDINSVVKKVLSWQDNTPIVQTKDHPFTLQKMCAKTLNIYTTLCEDE